MTAPGLAAATGVVLRDMQLRWASTARLARMDNELPTILEFITLSLAAGGGIRDALRWVARSTSG